MKKLLDLFKREKKAKKGLLALEWVVMGYLILTTMLMLFTYTKVHNPGEMLWGRVQIVFMTLALWAVYRMLPCRFTRLCRILAQMALLSWWYPDTYEFNRMFPNLDHVFATWEQQMFGCQPALLFSQWLSSPVFSELMNLGYWSYYPMIAATALYFFFWRNDQFGRAAFIIMASFFIYYLIYIAIPVTGPQYYYMAVGVDDIAHGIFPNVHDWFANHQECMENPGWHDGLFYRLVSDAHNAGERPTAAFPSSHVGVSTILLLLIWTARNRRLLYWLLPFYVLLCFSTVYIRAHYAIDVLGGWVSAFMLFFGLKFYYDHFIVKE